LYIYRVNDDGKHVVALFALMKDWQLQAMIEDCEVFNREYFNDIKNEQKTGKESSKLELENKNDLNSSNNEKSEDK
jgi:hypothetical protein